LFLSSARFPCFKFCNSQFLNVKKISHDIETNLMSDNTLFITLSISLLLWKDTINTEINACRLIGLVILKRLFQFPIVRGKKDCCLSCKRVGGIWYESEWMFRENLNGGMRVNGCSGRILMVV
jgi:hypothetical protein